MYSKLCSLVGAIAVSVTWSVGASDDVLYNLRGAANQNSTSYGQNERSQNASNFTTIANATGVTLTNATQQVESRNETNNQPAMKVPDNTTEVEDVTVMGGCLCIFDMDRTLTGDQGNLGACPNNRILHGHHDSAYGGGTLTLSELGQNIGSTFCGGCHLGGITAHATFRYQIEKLVHHRVVRNCDRGCKVQEARKMAARVGVHRAQVYFFDDTADNVYPFHGSGMNARQVSCGSRSGSRGLCGGRLWEVTRRYGVSTCR